MYIRRLSKSLALLVLFLPLHAVTTYGQEYSYIRYEARDGLGAAVVYDALQDEEGFMWFATENGLSRFDGKDFKTFTTKDGLPDNEILRLFLDSKGRVWIMPFKATVCYYYHGKIFNKNNDSLVSQISLQSYPEDIAEDKYGNLFITEENAWHEILQHQSIRTINRVNNAPVDVQGVGVNNKGEVEILVEAYPQLKYDLHYLVHTQTGAIETVSEKPNWTDPTATVINPDYTIIPSKHISHLTIYQGSTELVSTAIPSNTISISYIDKRRLAINTRNGIEFFDPQTKSFSGLYFKGFAVTSTFQDKENNLWLTTDGSGVLMVPSLQFRNYAFEFGNQTPGVFALCREGDSVFAGGTGRKIWKINVNDLRFSSTATSRLEVEKIVSLLPYRGSVQVQGNGYFENPFTRKKIALSLKSVKAGRNGILYASHRNVILVDSLGNQKAIWEERSTAALEADSGFYIGTLNGLYHRSYDGKFTNLGTAFPVLSSRIVDLAASGGGVVWIATKGNGVVAFANNRLLYHLTESQGLSSDNCTALYIDSNITWVGTDKGLNRIESIDGKTRLTRFSTSDGLPSDIVNAIVAVGKKVFVGSPNGLTYFELDNISQKSSCDLQLTGIFVSNKYWAYDSTGFSLRHNNNDISFEFSGISFKSAGDVTYQYRLLGLHPEWRTTIEKELSFPSLPTGKFVFQLQATNKYGVKSPVKEVSFTIEKLWWEKTWFRVILLLVLSSLVSGLFRYRISVVKRKEKERAQLNQHILELEQRALRSQMNPHFIFNSLNSIQQYVAERDITGANQFITDLSLMMRLTLDLSAKPFISISQELTYIDTYLRLEKTRLENQFDYSILVDPALDLQEIYLPSLLIQPYVENSIRHGIKYKKEGKGLIKIMVQRKENVILVGIEDNGVGRDEAARYKSKFHIQYQSKGMSINKERIDLLNSYNYKQIKIDIEDLSDDDNRPSGTRVNIHLPQ